MPRLMPNPLLTWLRERHRGAVLLLLAAVLALYLPFLSNPFFFDDLGLVNAAQRPLPWGSALLTVRGLPYNTIFHTLQWVGDSLPHAYRLADALLHAANAIALFFLLYRLLREHARADQGGAELAAACAALLFALHPVSTYAAGYLAQRSILMSTLFALLACLAWLQAQGGGHRLWLIASIVSYYLACFSKEHAIFLPLILLAMLLLQGRRAAPRRAALGLSLAAMLAIAIFVLVRKADVLGTAYEPMSTQLFSKTNVHASGLMLHALSIATQAGLFFKYVFLWLLPLPAWMAIDMRAPFLSSLLDVRAVVGLLAYAAWGLGGLGLLLKRGRRGLLGLAMLAPWLLFGVEFASVRVQESFVLYRSYLWMPMAMLAPALLVLAIDARRRLAVPLAGLLCVLLAAGAFNRLSVAADPWLLWNDAAVLLHDDRQPGADRILYNRGQAALSQGRPADAVADFGRVTAVSPEIWQAWHALGVARLANRQPALAEQDFARALAQQPRHPGLLHAYAVALWHNGRRQEAQLQMQASCDLSHMPACLALAGLAAQQKKPS